MTRLLVVLAIVVVLIGSGRARPSPHILEKALEQEVQEDAAQTEQTSLRNWLSLLAFVPGIVDTVTGRGGPMAKEQDMAQAEREEQEMAQAEREQEMAQAEREEQEMAQAEREQEMAQAEREEQEMAQAEREQDMAQAERKQEMAQAEREQEMARAEQTWRNWLSLLALVLGMVDTVSGGGPRGGPMFQEQDMAQAERGHHAAQTEQWQYLIPSLLPLLPSIVDAIPW